MRLEGQIDLAAYGSAKLLALAARLKEAGDNQLRSKMLAKLRESGQDLRDKEKLAALALPADKYEVGLRASIANATVLRTRSSGNSAGVKVLVNRSKMPGGKGHLPVLMDRGSWRHPVFGNRRNWVDQRSRAGWFTQTGYDEEPAIHRKMLEILEETAREIEGS